MIDSGALAFHLWITQNRVEDSGINTLDETTSFHDIYSGTLSQIHYSSNKDIFLRTTYIRLDRLDRFTSPTVPRPATARPHHLQSQH